MDEADSAVVKAIEVVVAAAAVLCFSVRVRVVVPFVSAIFQSCELQRSPSQHTHPHTCADAA